MKLSIMPAGDFILVSLFTQVNIAANGNAIGPAGGLDLSGFKDYRIVIRFDGAPNAKFIINELYGPAGGVQQLNIDIDKGQTDSLSSLNYRKKFDVFGPMAFHIRIFNQSNAILKVSGSLYAVK